MTGKEPGQTGVREVKRGGQRKLSPVRREGVEVQGDVQVGGGQTGGDGGNSNIIGGRFSIFYHNYPPSPLQVIPVARSERGVLPSASQSVSQVGAVGRGSI